MKKQDRIWKFSFIISLLVFICNISVSKTGAEIIDSDFLKCQGTKVVNKRGEQVLLRGINIGGWLIQENWMCPIKGQDRAWANLDTLNALEERFGTEKTQELFDEYQDNWITDWDIKSIANKGCNVIRVPFWYRNFMLDEKGTWINSNLDDNPGFKRLDWIISQASKNNMYVILDMHGCPGGQSIEQHSGTSCKSSLYEDQGCQSTMELLWTTIAERYKDNPVVAAYDIMNEPVVTYRFFCKCEHKYNPLSSKTHKLVSSVYDKMVKAIRKVDNNHINILSFVHIPSSLPDPNVMLWDNVMYQVHYYFPHPGWNTEFNRVFSFYMNWILKYTNKYDIPAYLGEFKNLGGIKYCDQRNINWTTWAYKGSHGKGGTFFWYYSKKDAVAPKNDSFEDIKRKWGKTLRTKDNFLECKEVTEKFNKII